MKACEFVYTAIHLNLMAMFLLTPMSRVLLEKLTGSQPVSNFPAIYGTGQFTTALSYPVRTR
jgi:hypothetical protein